MIKINDRFLVIAIIILGTASLTANTLFYKKYSNKITDISGKKYKKSSYLSIRITPKEAKLFLDGKPFSEGELKPGNYELSARADGYIPRRIQLKLKGGEYRIVNIQLKPLPIEVYFETDPPGALIYLDGKAKGKTPKNLKIYPKSYQITLKLKGFPPVVGNIILSPGMRSYRIFRRLGGVIRRRERDGAEMVWIPEGEYSIGLTRRGIKILQDLCSSLRGERCPAEWWIQQFPVKKVYISGFWLDRYEVSREKYRRCVRAGACSYRRDIPLTPDNFPAVGMSRSEAEEYCRWVGGRLPNAREWEAAGRGLGGRLYPWGNRWIPKRANLGKFDREKRRSAPDPSDGYRIFSPVGKFIDDSSLFGVLDLAGNVREWTHSCGKLKEGRGKPCRNAVIKGGSWRSPPWEAALTYKELWPSQKGRLDVGFRCRLPGP